MTYRFRVFAALIMIPLATSTAVAANGPSKRLLQMTPQSVLDKVTVRDDPLEFNVVISTEKAHSGGRLPAGTVGSNVYLVAAIDRYSGHARYEVRQEVRYFGVRRDYEMVHYLESGRIERAALSAARHGADNCPNSELVGECLKTKTLMFTVTEDTLRHIASSYSTDRTSAWMFRFKDKGGEDLTNKIMPAEVAGLLKAVETYRAEHAFGQQRPYSAQLLPR